MAIGSKNNGESGKALDEQGDGQSRGRPAAGELEGSAYSPLGNPGMKHWQAGYIARPGLDDRSNIFFAAIEMTRMPMVITDPNLEDNPIVFTNRAFLDMTGYAEGKVLGRNCRFLQGEQTDPATVAEVRAAVSEHRAVAVDILNYKADGSPFWNALFIGPIFDQEGRLLYFFASQLDITSRRMSEQSYLQAQKMEAIGQLTAGMAHDFNNLLQVISGNLEMARMTLSDHDPATQAIDRAQLGATRAAKLTQQLLTFARKQRLDPKEVSLNSLVVEFSEMLVRTLGDKVDLHLDLKPGLPPCRLDPTHMEMALLNVLINARDAMPRGGRVTIATSLHDNREKLAAHHLPGRTYVMICVIDEGEGMSPEVARRATEPFFTTKGPGTGLGLAMVHGFVQQSQGRLEIDSAPGKGTTIKMIFPVSQRPAVDAVAGGDGTATSPRPPDQPRPRSILVVDDSQEVRELAEAYLRTIGYRVLSAPSGEAALAMLEDHDDIDLLFTDVIMPGGMNGLQLVERAREWRPDLPVLLATGYMEELPGQGQGQGRPALSLDILSKPYRQTELAERVKAVLARTRRHASSG